jgi:tRNA pseudouridine55 synthase
MGQEKEYIGTIELGIRTASFDLETPVLERRDALSVARAAVEQCAAGFVGDLRQKPPMFSALKKDGKPLYSYARRGEDVVREERSVHVARFDVDRYEPPVLSFRIICSKGTYIRSIADDLGTRLGCGATLTSLRRTRIGRHEVADASTMEQLQELSDALGLRHDRTHAHRPTA